METLTLYQLEISPFGDKVRRVLHHKGLPYEIVEVPLSKLATMKNVTPTGKLPALRIGGEIVVDSTDIVRAIEARWPTPSIYPEDPVDRARAHILEDWADESLYWFELTMRMVWPDNARVWVPKLAENDPAPLRAIAPYVVPRISGRSAVAQGIGRKPRYQVLEELRRHVEAVDSLVSAGGHLVGGRLSIADIAIFVQLHCVAGTPDGKAILDRHPNVRAWMARIDAETSRPVATQGSASR